MNRIIKAIFLTAPILLFYPVESQSSDRKTPSILRDILHDRGIPEKKWTDKTGINIENTKNSIIQVTNEITGINKSLNDFGIKTPNNDFQFISTESGAQIEFYQPGFANKVLDYNVEPSTSAFVNLGAGIFAGKPLVFWRRAWSSEGELKQRETMIAQNRKSPTAFESIKYGLNLENAAKRLLGDHLKIEDNRLLYVLLSPSIEHEHSEFYGSATALDMVALIRHGSNIQGNVISGNISPLNTGEELGFKTVFDTWRLSFNTLAGIKDLPPDTWLKLSYFQHEYRRPTPHWQRGVRYFSCNTCGPNSRYLVFDADYESKGLGTDVQFSAPFKDKAWRVLFGANLDIGLQNRITLHDTAVNLYDGDTYYVGAGLRAGIRYDKVFTDFYSLDVSGQLMATYSLSSWSTEFVSIADQDQQESVSLSLSVKF